jgi:two-component system, sensor histidine kinase
MTPAIEIKELELRKMSQQLAAAKLKLASTRGKLLQCTRALEVKSRELEEHGQKYALLDQELSGAKECAVRAHQAKSLFLANMSHEIRTPMTGMLGMIDFTLNSELKPDQVHQLEIARKAGKTLVRVINDVLDFARIEAGQLSLLPTVFDLRQTLAQLTGLLSPEAAKKNIALLQTVSKSLPEQILADEARIRQILLNLLGNAVKFTERGRIELRADFFQDYLGKYLRFAVSDTGVGIPEELRSTIFDAFARTDPGQARRNSGASGLGLAISAKLVSLMGGSIVHRDNSPEGSTFVVTIPVAVPLELLPAARVPKEASPGGLTILIAEDDPVIMEVMTLLTSRAGHRVLPAADGQEAFRIWESERPHVVLMDVQMPNLDGLETTRKIRGREQEIGGRVPIYGLTAHVRDEDINRCLDAGMTGHIGKPIDFPDVLEILSRHRRGDAHLIDLAGKREARRYENVERVGNN